MTATLTKAGAKDRLRLGAGARTPITLPGVTSLSVAEDRFNRLRQMVVALVESGKQSEAPRIIGDAARVANNPKAFAGIERAVRDLCTREGGLDKPMTMSELCHLYTSGELHRRHPRHVDKKGKADRTRECERRRLALLCQTIGAIPVADLTLDDAEKAMDQIPKGKSDGWLRQHAQPLYHLMKIAAYPMRLIKASPIPSEFVPAQGDSAATPILYPDEEKRLVTFHEWPLDERLMWGVQVREGFRPSGVAMLRWEDLDLERGSVTHQDKTEDSRLWFLGDDVTRVLRWLELESREKGEPFVFPRYARDPELRTRVAARFREALLAAGITRVDLHRERTARRRPIRAHDLRTSFITVALASGKGDEQWVMARSGHTTSDMLARYKRVAKELAALKLSWFAPLDEVLRVGSGVGSNREFLGGSGTLETTPCSLKRSQKRPRDPKSGAKPPSSVLSCPEKRAQGGGGGLCESAPESTATALDEDSLTDLLALATKAKRWDLVALLGGQLEEIERVRAASVSPKVASLDAARAKRERGK